jgi:hypothetical protein
MQSHKLDWIVGLSKFACAVIASLRVVDSAFIHKRFLHYIHKILNINIVARF